MKAEVIEHLAHRTRHGAIILVQKIEDRKENIVDKINSYVIARCSNKHMIPVERFEVKVYNYKKEVINRWTYTPTYRY